VLSSGIAIDASGSDLAALTAIEGIVDVKQERTGRGQGSNQQAQEDRRGQASVAAVAVVNAMVDAESLQGNAGEVDGRPPAALERLPFTIRSSAALPPEARTARRQPRTRSQLSDTADLLG
jgi:hypothetical protein